MSRYFLLLLFMFSTIFSFANDGFVYLKIRAKKGDTIYRLLYNYRLHKNPCNSEAFYKINNLSEKGTLLADKEYKLPIKIYRYDNKSIRTTTKNNNYDRALTIQNYNKILVQDNIKTYYLDDNILFVPAYLDKSGCVNFTEEAKKIKENPIELATSKSKKTETIITTTMTDSTIVSKKVEKKVVPIQPSTKDNKETLEIIKKEEVIVTKKSTSKDKKNKKKSSKKSDLEIGKIIKTDIYFGKYNIVKLFDNTLKDQVFYIISGHGGPDPGAMKKKNGHQLCEDEYAYDVSLRLAKKLLQHGATVHMIIQDPNDGIRDETYLKLDRDEICKLKGTIPLNQLKRLQQRVASVNQLYQKEKKQGKSKHTMISIHVDSRSVGHQQDVFFYHAPKSTIGKQKALKLQKVFKQKYNQHRKGRGYEGSVTPRNLYVLRKSNPPAVFVELANIQNANNHKRILPKENRQVLADWLFEGLIK